MKTLFAILLLLACFDSYAQPVPVKLKLMQGYFFYSDEALGKGVNYKVLSSRKEMDRLFGKTSRPDTPDFAKELMLVLVMPETKRDMKLGFERISVRAGEFIEVYCNLKLKGHMLTYLHNPIAVAVIPRSENTHMVHFYDDKTGVLLRKVAMKN